jgi:hypothetical protein
MLKSVMSTSIMTTKYLGGRSGGAVSINTLLQIQGGLKCAAYLHP